MFFIRDEHNVDETCVICFVKCGRVKNVFYKRWNSMYSYFLFSMQHGSVVNPLRI